MSTDILVVDCRSGLGTHSLMALLGGVRVKSVCSVGGLQQHFQDAKTEAPCVVLCVACSRREESLDLVRETLRNAGSIPVVVIDERFESDCARLLIGCGASDYLDAQHLCAEKLLRGIEWAILRNGHRAFAPASPPTRRADDYGHEASELRQALNALPPRERQVLQLLAVGLTPKQIAARCGTRPKTVWTQLTKLRSRFEVDSNYALSVLGLRVVQLREQSVDE